MDLSHRQLGLISVILVTTLTSACATSGRNRDSKDVAAAATPPQVWSDHKQLDVPVAVCAERAFNVLNALGYSQVVRNGNYSYGNSNESRAAVKCVDESAQRSFVYFIVAGPRRETVEQLRNQIARKL
jgi:hypothetical protein